jgi:hypothetical protein
MSKRRKTIILAIAILLAIVFTWHIHSISNQGSIYEGRHVAEWVADALKDENAEAVVLRIGEPAVPFIAKQGLHDICHSFPWLSWDSLYFFRYNHPWLPLWIERKENCDVKHWNAMFLLQKIGTNAQAAIPDVIHYMEHCPEHHSTDWVDAIDVLREISGTNMAAIPYLTKWAQMGDLRAGYAAYEINGGKIDVFVEACNVRAKRDPRELIISYELDWARDDDDLNNQLIPLFERMYSDPRLDADYRFLILDWLTKRGAYSKEALARLQTLQKNNPSLRASDSIEEPTPVAPITPLPPIPASDLPAPAK